MRRSRPERPKKRAGRSVDAGLSGEVVDQTGDDGIGDDAIGDDPVGGDAPGDAPIGDDPTGDTPTGDVGPGDDPAECERRAVAFLARREHSRGELERKLRARGFVPAVVADTLNRLEQNGLLSGQRFISGFIASRAARGSGPAKIRAELAQRGIRPDEAAAAVRAADEDWAALARRVRVKRFGDPPPREYAERARQARFLRGRGFDAEQIDAALEVGADSD